MLKTGHIICAAVLCLSLIGAAPAPSQPTTRTQIGVVLFAQGQASLSVEAKSALAETANLIATDPGMQVCVAGHSDATGNAEANLRLSRVRAERVRQYLLRSQDKLPPDNCRAGRLSNHKVEVTETLVGTCYGLGRADCGVTVGNDIGSVVKNAANFGGSATATTARPLDFATLPYTAVSNLPIVNGQPVFPRYPHSEMRALRELAKWHSEIAALFDEFAALESSGLINLETLTYDNLLQVKSETETQGRRCFQDSAFCYYTVDLESRINTILAASPFRRGQLPMRCEDYRESSRNAALASGRYVLFHEGSPDQPYEVYCHFANGKALEFLELRSFEGASNSSLWAYPPKDDNSVEELQDLRTIFRFVRLVPGRLHLLAHSFFPDHTSNVEPASGDRQHAIFASAVNCHKDHDRGRFVVDLYGTPFAVHPQMTWYETDWEKEKHEHGCDWYKFIWCRKSTIYATLAADHTRPEVGRPRRRVEMSLDATPEDGKCNLLAPAHGEVWLTYVGMGWIEPSVAAEN